MNRSYGVENWQNSHAKARKRKARRVGEVLFCQGRAGDLLGELEAIEEGEGAEDAEGAIDETPVERDAADRAAEEGVGQNKEAGDQAGVEDPDVADRVNERTDEKAGDDDVGEGEPIGAVRVPWVAGIDVAEAITDGEEPLVEPVGGGSWGKVLDAAPAGEEAEFPIQRKGGDAAGDEGEDEEGEDEAVAAEWAQGFKI